MKRFAIGLGAALVGLAEPALAGPPYLNDDPVPTDLGHWEIYHFVNGAKDHGDLAGEAGVDFNYGAFKDVQLTAVFPIGYDSPSGYRLSHVNIYSGVVELALKYRFLHQDEHGLTPDVAFFPRAFVPTNSHFGAAKTNLLLPVWAQKDWGDWSVFGGGGYQINPGAGQKNFWQGGLAVTRAFGKALTLGGEVFGQSTDKRGGTGFTALNVATTYRFTEHWSLLASAGPVRRSDGAHGSVFYLSLKADY
jgi:hypothetical protein